jgi:hypothetical protein
MTYVRVVKCTRHGIKYILLHGDRFVLRIPDRVAAGATVQVLDRPWRVSETQQVVELYRLDGTYATLATCALVVKGNANA